ncbi:META domain-containing protein [Sphingosinicella sp. YJ22]|uniref:META domain-containing protein n=1 Tax=Sphingosinicella sp. YJ22 TaxID=1104780 RepID=UPI0014081F15|nr:META domain-containing protein [Sphingosinicella sp. YJ22]
MKHHPLLALCALAPLAACTAPIIDSPVAPAVPAAPDRTTYRALGTEPFWNVTIVDGRMVYQDAEQRVINVPTPEPRPSFNGRRYVSQRLTIDITHGRCSDGMSDRVYADTVLVLADGRELRGCGGAILPPATLDDTSWRIVAIDGADVSREDGYEIQFEANRLSGRAGCNRFGGSYRVSSDGFQAGPLAMTRMACPGARMAHEQAVARLLAGRVRLYYPDGDTLIMRGVAGGEIRLRRSI